MPFTEELAAERTRSNLELAQQLKYSRHLRLLRRARRMERMERRAERRMIAAWRRAAELRSALESVDY
jgi:hypothetical protein